jgi:hypothetical protein
VGQYARLYFSKTKANRLPALKFGLNRPAAAKPNRIFQAAAVGP